MFHVVLMEPEIPPNTGNIIRLCANCGAHLHLVRPLGFEMDDKRLRRAGLDYHEFAAVKIHADFDQFITAISPSRVFALSTKGTKRYAEVSFAKNDALVFGPETRGLSEQFRQRTDISAVLTIPMLANSRSLNLSNAVGLIVYEAWRQNGFVGAV